MLRFCMACEMKRENLTVQKPQEPNIEEMMSDIYKQLGLNENESNKKIIPEVFGT